MTTPHEKAIERACIEASTVTSYVTPERMQAAISVYLSSIGGIVCAMEPVGYAYRDKRWDGDHWHLCGSDSKPRAFEGRMISSAHLPIEAGNGGDGWLDIASAPKTGESILADHAEWGEPEIVAWNDGEDAWCTDSWCWKEAPTHWRSLPARRSTPSNEEEKQS